MTPDQRLTFIAFIGNMLNLLHDSGHSRACAEDAALCATACLCSVIFGFKPENDIDDEITDFTRLTIQTALNMFYGKAKEEVKAHVVC